ncbi:MAG: alcohol dehydrogenase, partial [Bacteroidales bacterium]|nr:alcohol dehydrogenase [Bacteroidales bacterium]
LYIFDEKYGNVGLVEPNPKKFKLKGTFKIEEGNGPHWAHPTIYNGYLLLRHGKALMVYDIKKNRN